MEAAIGLLLFALLATSVIVALVMALRGGQG